MIVLRKHTQLVTLNISPIKLIIPLSICLDYFKIDLKFKRW